MNTAAFVFNRTQVLKVLRGQGDALSAHTQPACHQFMGEFEIIVANPILIDKQHSCQLLHDRVTAIAYGRLRGAQHQQLHVPQDQEPESRGCFELLQNEPEIGPVCPTRRHD